MTPGFVQRHYDYVLGPNQDARLASIAAGQTIEGVTLQLDTDAPFILRSRALRVQYDASRYQTGLHDFLMRWAGPDRDFQSQDFIRQSLLAPYFGQMGNPIPVFPQVVYPQGGQITVDLKNDGAGILTNLTMYFRGVKLFGPGQVRSYRYPDAMGLLPYTYKQTITALPVTSGPVRVTFKPKGDADFVIRGGQAGLPYSATPVNEVFFKLRDEDEKPYSNDFVHMDVLFGNSHMGATYPVGSSAAVAPVGCGPNSPGLFYPEIYVPANHLMYYDILRTDVSFAGAVAVDFTLQFIGQKVFEK